MFTKKDTPSYVVKEYPQASDLFKKYDINFCCKGDETIESQCVNKDLNVEEVIDELNKFYEVWKEDEGRSIGLAIRSLEELIDEVILKHDQLTEELSVLQQYVMRINQVHGQEQPHLQKLENLYFQLLEQMNDHIEAESFLFSLIKEEKEEEKLSLATTKKKLQESLGSIGKLLKEIREVTNDYVAPAYACGTYRVTYDRLSRLEEKTLEYMMIEQDGFFTQI